MDSAMLNNKLTEWPISSSISAFYTEANSNLSGLKRSVKFKLKDVDYFKTYPYLCSPKNYM